MFNNSNCGYSLADIAAATGNGNNCNNGNSGFNGESVWILLFFILIIACGWGNNGWGNGGNRDGGSAGASYIVPDIQRGFDQATVTTGINGISNDLCNGFSNVQQSLCSGFAGVNSAIANGFAQAEIASNARQIADMQQNFGIQSALQQCCCDNRAAVADLKYTVATENCADRTASAQNTRDIIDAIRNSDQMIMDKICALELQGVQNQLEDVRRENVALQNQLNMTALRESQATQNTFIQSNLANQIDDFYNRLSNCPVPSIPVYGRQPIFTCSTNNCNTGCCGGCGC